jgi:hypothetical protein
VPREAHEERPVVPEVCGPPVLASVKEIHQVLLDRGEIYCLKSTSILLMYNTVDVGKYITW